MPKTERKAKARIDRRMKEELTELGREWDLKLRETLDESSSETPSSSSADGPQVGPAAGED